MTCRGIIVLMIGIGWVAGGCRTSGRTQDIVQEDTVADTLPGVDPQRAYLSLSQIDPVPERPERPDTLAPVSARAARQIKKASKLVEEQRYTEAAIELERALRYDPNHPDIHRTLANLHWEAGNLERAKNHVKKTLAANPDDALAHYIDGRCRSMDGHYASAITAYRTALHGRDFGDDPQVAALAHYHLGQALESEGYLSAALEQYAAHEQRVSSLEADPSNLELAGLATHGGRQVRLLRSSMLEKLGRFGQAADLLADVVQRAPGDAELCLRHARLLTLAGRPDDALIAIANVSSNEPAVMDLLFEIHRKSGHPERAIDAVQARLTQNPDNEALVLKLAEFQEQLGRREDARRSLTSFLKDHGDAHAIRDRLFDLLVGAGIWTEALQLCADGIERDPDRAAAAESKVAALADEPKAVDHLLRSDDPGETSMLSYLRGFLALRAGRSQQAEALLTRAHTQDPASIPVRLALTRVYMQMYRYDDALRVAGRRDRDRPEHTRLETALGDVHERLDDVESAELHYKAATQLDRANARAMLALGKLYNRSNRRLQAQRQLRVLLDIHPDHELAREMLAFTYFEDGKPDVAMEHFDVLKRHATTPLVAARCAALLDQVHERDPEVYRQALKEAMETHGPDATTWVAIAESYEPTDGPEKKHEAYLAALRLDPQREDVILGLVNTAQRLLAFEEAAQRLRGILPRRPNRLQWRLGLIDLMRTLQDYSAAMSLIEQQLARDNLDDIWRRRFRFAMIDTLRQAGRDDEILAALTTWAEDEKDQEEWSDRLAREYLHQDQPAVAVTIYDELYQANPDDRDMLRRLVNALVLADRHDRGSQYVLDWLNDDPQNDNALFSLVRVLVDAERFDDAVELVKNRLLHTFQRQGYQDLMVGVLAQAERFDEALEFLEGLMDEVHALMRIEPGGPGQQVPETTGEELIRRPNEPLTLEGLHQRLFELRTSLVGLLITSKDYRAAEAELTDWLERTRNPRERLEYLRRLAACLRLAHDEERANEVLARMLLLEPDSATINNDLAYVWIDRGIKLDEAEPMIRRSLARNPRQAAYLDTYGWLKYKQGDFYEAKKWLVRAAGARTSQDPVILDHLGDTLWRLGDAETAVEKWKAAVGVVSDREDEDLVSDDERRVRDQTPAKIESARAGRKPALAPTAAETPPADVETGDAGSGK